MKKFKPLFLTILSLLLTTILVACSQTKTTHLQRFDEASSDTRVTLEYQEDKLLKQAFTYTMLYDAMGIKNKAEAEKELQRTDLPFKDLEGVSYKVEYQDDRAVQILEFDFSKADLKKDDLTALINLLGMEEAKEGDYISYRKSLKSLLSSGFKEVKDGKFQELEK